MLLIHLASLFSSGYWWYPSPFVHHDLVALVAVLAGVAAGIAAAVAVAAARRTPLLPAARALAMMIFRPW